MPETFTTTCVVQVNDQTRTFFKAMNFHPIPDDAKYICFLDDGDSTFLTDDEDVRGLCGFMDPDAKMLMLRYSTAPIKFEV